MEPYTVSRHPRSVTYTRRVYSKPNGPESHTVISGGSTADFTSFSCVNGLVGNDFKKATSYSYVILDYPTSAVCSYSNSYSDITQYVTETGRRTIPMDTTPSAFPANIFELSREKALSKFFESMRGSELNLGLSLAEYKQTLALTTNLLSKVRHSAYALPTLIARATRKQGGRDILDDAASAYLGNKYGIQPLLSDVYGTISHVNSSLLERVVEGFGSHVSNTFTDGISAGLAVRSVASSHSVWTKVSRRYRVSDPDLYNLSRLTSLNPVSFAWELVPLSFVWDYLWNLGGYMQELESSLAIGMTPMPGYGYDTVTSRIVDTQYYDAPPGASYNIVGSGMLKRRSKSRNATDVQLVPLLPRPRIPQSGSQIKTLVALSWQRLPRVLKSYGFKSAKRDWDSFVRRLRAEATV